MDKISGEIIVQVYEASRIRDVSLISGQNTYVKLKSEGRKQRTKASTGGTAPRWNEEHSNTLRLPVNDIMKEVSVELWRESQLRPNGKIDVVQVPVEPYARNHGPPIPRWHTLSSQGSLLFSMEFQPTETSKDLFEKLEKIPPKRSVDPTEVKHVERYHDEAAEVEVSYGSEICLSALGDRWVKFGSCLLTHFQKSKKCLQLTKQFDEKVILEIHGDQKGMKLTYGSRFTLKQKSNGMEILVGTGMFEILPVDPTTKKQGESINYGDSVYLQAVYAKTGTQTLGAEGESLHVFDPTIYISPNTPKVAFTIKYADGLLKKPLTLPARNLSVNITTYNVWMMPDKITAFADVSPHKCERAQLIPSALPDSDVVVFNEAFCHIARPVLLEAMKEKGYYYESPVVGHLVGRFQTKFLDGGVVLVSKHPIIETDIMRFGGVCHGDDSLADKGVVYGKIMKDGHYIHVFASHTQAWTQESAVKVRQDQFRMMRNFVDEKCIPSNEPVFIVGDFNVNKLLNEENGEYDEMVRILESEESSPPKDVVTSASFDADHNPLAADGPSSDGVCERLDFILTCNHHKQPEIGEVQVFPIHSKEPWKWEKKGEFTDLSDHYPVTSKFTFSYDEE